MRFAPVPLLVALSALAIAAHGPAAPPKHGHRLLVGAVEDDAKYGASGAYMQLARSANFGVVLVSSVWRPPLTSPDGPELARLRATFQAARNVGITPIVAVYSFGDFTPNTAAERAELITYAATIERALPDLRYLSIGNEPNSGDFWRPQFGRRGSDAAAASYYLLLSQAYDVLKATNPAVTVIGGSLAPRGADNPHGGRKTHSPSQFIADLGAAYRASGRRRPIMDIFSLHPYPPSSAVPPSVGYGRSKSIGIADYPRLVRLLTAAFGRPVPIAYGEYGIETRIPRGELSLYNGVQPSAADAVTEARQADDYISAIELAACQPLVRMLLFFHVTDEASLSALQTGLFYPNDEPKSSLGPVALEVEAARRGQVECAP